MNIAQREFGIPKVLEPEYLASPWLDELSGMTYLSYFMKPGGPGYNATLRWVNSQTKHEVSNFTNDWNDGRVFCEIVKGLGGSAPTPDTLNTHHSSWESNIRKAVDAGRRLGVQPVLSPKDMANPDVEHLGIMAYAANLQWVTPRAPLSDSLAVQLQSTSGRVGEPTYFRVEVLNHEIDISTVRAYIVPPNSVQQSVKLNNHGEGMFVPDKYGMHEIVLEVNEDKLGGHFFRVLPRLMQVAPPGMAPCALGSLVEVLVNATGAPKTEDILVTAYSPSGRSLKCPLKKVDEGHSAIFKPDEAGIWEIAITYQGRHIQGGPFTCAVFDPNGVSVHGLDGAMPGRAHSFEIDARGVGVHGELHVDIVNEKHSLVCSLEKLLENKYRVTFMPRQNGKYRVYIYFNGYDVKGSPYILRVGTKGRSGKTRSSPHHENKYRSESPSMHYTTTTASPLSSSKYNDFRSAKREMYDHEVQRSFSPQSNNNNSHDDIHKTYTKRDTDVYSPTQHSPRRSDTEIYSSNLKSETRKTNNDYYYNKENELHSKKHETDATLLPSRHASESKYSSSSCVSKSYTDSGSLGTRIRNDTFSPIQIQTASPVPRHTPINSPITVMTTSRYETNSRNVSSPRNYSASPTPRQDTNSPINYVPASTQRVASPISIQRVTSPITTITHRVTSPLTSPLTVRVSSTVRSLSAIN